MSVNIILRVLDFFRSYNFTNICIHFVVYMKINLVGVILII